MILYLQIFFKNKGHKFVFGGFESYEVFRKESGESDAFWCVIIWFTEPRKCPVI